MSETEPVISSVSRSELAARAAAQEQRNRPRVFVLAGFVVLAAGLIFLLVGRSSLAEAQAERRREINSARNVLIQKARLDRHDASAVQGGGRFIPVPNFTTLAENAARLVGLTPLPTLSRQLEDRDGELIIRTYRYERVTSRDIEALIGWVAEVESMVPGVEISILELEPSRTQWELKITFVKPELSP